MHKRYKIQRITIVRHGQSEFNSVNNPQSLNIEKLEILTEKRDADVDLTALGIEQSEQTGKHIAQTSQFDICFSSPYLRALKSAQIILLQLPYKLYICVDDLLRDKEFGKLHGLSQKEKRKRFLEEIAMQEREGKYWYRPPQGENYPDVKMRINLFLNNLASYDYRNILVVTHGLTANMFRAIFEHLDEKQVLGLEKIVNCGILEYRLDKKSNLKLVA